MSVYAEVRAALEARLALVSGIPADRAEENDAFEPEPGTAWLRHRLAYGPERLLTMPAQNGWVERRGVWRILLHFPLQGGTTTADDLAQAVVDAFPRGKTLVSGDTTVHCDGARRWGGGRDIDAAWYVVPVDIAWHVHTRNLIT